HITKKGTAMDGANLFPMKPSGCCLKCSNNACLVCHRCGDFYCSKECQLSDWQRHRYICFPIPPLVKPMAHIKYKMVTNNTHPMTNNLNAGTQSSDRNVATPIPIQAPVFSESQSKDKMDAKNITSKNAAQNNTNGNNTTPPTANISSGSLVYITSFTSANICYIRDASEAAEDDRFAVRQKINSLVTKLPRKPKIKYEEYGINKFNGYYHRVKSMDRANPSRLLLLDEGIIKILNLVDMHEINSELLQLPCGSMQVKLEDAPYMGFDVGVFKQFEGIKFIVTFKPNGHVELREEGAEKSLNTLIIEIYKQPNDYNNQFNLNPSAIPCQLNQKSGAIIKINSNSSQTNEKNANSTNNRGVTEGTKPELKKNESCLLSTTEGAPKPNLNETNNNNPTESSQKLDKELHNNNNETLKESVKDLTPPSLNGENSTNMAPLLSPPFLGQRICTKSRDGLDICIVENANISRGILAAFDKSNMEDVQKMRSRLLEFKDSQHYRPVLKEFVIALSDVNGWCRAKVMEIKENLYSVLFVDFACSATVPEDYIRRYAPGFEMPCFTSICLIEGFPHKPSPRQIDFLNQNLKLNSVLHIDSISYLQDMAIIKCKTLIDQLNKL
ncbi:hypothetical protein KR093_002812, partial [Drosophila rubida]